ncbi:Sodium/glucose cotransporter 4, partial [Eudyptula albosignata]
LLYPVNYYKGSNEGQRAPKSSVREKISSSLAAMSQPTPATMELPALPGDTTVAFGVADIIVVVFYFAFVLVVGIWSSIRASRGTIGGYFLAGRSMTWWPIGASLMSSNVGSGLFIGLAGTGAAGGLAVGGFEWNATWALLALGWIFVPVYIAAGVVTMPEYLQKRFGGQRIQIYMSILSLILYIFTKISTDIFSGALFIQISLGWNLYLSTVVLLAVTAVYTIAGGLTAVIYTDALQTLIMVLGALVLMFIGKVSWLIGEVPDDWRLANVTPIYKKGRKEDPGNYRPVSLTSVLGKIMERFILRALTRHERDNQGIRPSQHGFTRGRSCLTNLISFYDQVTRLVDEGKAVDVVYLDFMGCVDPDICKRVCGAAVGCSNIAYPKLVIELMPDGLRGLMIAVMMAALMSSLTSIFNSSSTLFVIDIWQRIRRKASEQELMIVGRVFILILVVISILWIPIIQSANSGKLFDYIQSVSSCLAPPITALFILAIFCKRINEPGAFWGLIIGLAVGLVRMIIEFIYSTPSCGEEDRRPAVLKDLHYLYFALILCVLTVIVIVLISVCTPPIPEEKLACLTWWTRHRKAPAIGLKNYKSEAAQISPANGESNLVESADSGDKEEAAKPPCWKMLYLWFCGLSTGPTPTLSQEERAALEQRLTSIEEKPLWKTVCGVNAILLLTINVFLWAYFG